MYSLGTILRGEKNPISRSEWVSVAESCERIEKVPLAVRHGVPGHYLWDQDADEGIHLNWHEESQCVGINSSFFPNESAQQLCKSLADSLDAEFEPVTGKLAEYQQAVGAIKTKLISVHTTYGIHVCKLRYFNVTERHGDAIYGTFWDADENRLKEGLGYILLDDILSFEAYPSGDDA